MSLGWEPRFEEEMDPYLDDAMKAVQLTMSDHHCRVGHGGVDWKNCPEEPCRSMKMALDEALPYSWPSAHGTSGSSGRSE